MAEGHIVKDFYIGNTRIKIADDYCRDKTPEDVNAILERLSRQLQRSFTAAASVRERNEKSGQASNY